MKRTAEVAFGSTPEASCSELVMSMVSFNRRCPIWERGDVQALKRNFDGDWCRFVRAWAMREPVLVAAFYEGGFEGAKRVAASTRYEFLPRRLVRWMKPEAVEQWSEGCVRQVAAALSAYFSEPTSVDDRLAGYRRILRVASMLPGVGRYSQEHLVRTACLVMDHWHPSSEFVMMGGGADRCSYLPLADLNIRDLLDFNIAMWDSFNDDTLPWVDAGELAYIVCMMPKKRCRLECVSRASHACEVVVDT